MDRNGRSTSDDLPAATASLLAKFSITQLQSNPGRYQWSRNLRTFIDNVGQQVLGWSADHPFEPAEILPIPKKKPGSRQPYRVLARYSLTDSVISGAFSAYLRALIDPLLDKHCYAFRLPRNGSPLTHHDAVRDLRTFAVGQRARINLWVAECDIQGFFDAVSHDVAKAAVSGLLAERDVAIDPRLGAFMQSFLTGFEYEKARTLAEARLTAKGVANPVLFDPRSKINALNIPLPDGTRLGIPQGSAFSCIVANAVLSAADRRSRVRIGSHARTFYARYCDDIIVVSTNRRVATTALSGYMASLRDLKLPFHSPQVVTTPASPRWWRTRSGRSAGRLFWKAKSKKPYLWTPPGATTGWPWIAFLGYHLRRDGKLRVRQSSVEKEVAKQRKAVDDILGGMCRSAWKRRDGHPHQIPRTPQILQAATMHMVSIGVGYPVEHSIRPMENSVCWANGFKLLREGHFDSRALQTLDRGRGRALGALLGRVAGLLRGGIAKERKEKQPRNRSKGKQFRLSFAGRPLSYVAQFLKETRNQ